MSIDASAAWRTGTGEAPSDDLLGTIDRWWRAANYLSVGQIYLLENPLLREPLTREHVKPRLLGHWGTVPGLTFVYAHLNRAIVQRRQSTIFIVGPGHGGPGLVAAGYLDGTYSEIYPHITDDVDGVQKLFKQFSFPGGVPSHVAPETPGSIHEGGELGYALSHAYGAAFDNPDLLVAAVVGDGEAETGPLATSWHANKFVNPVNDGVVLPILHLNGYKIANPTILARLPQDELEALLVGYGHKPYFFEAVEGDEHDLETHRRFAALLDEVLDEIAAIKKRAAEGDDSRPKWPAIVLRTPKGWTGPATIDGKKTTASWRAHQVPLANARDTDEHLRDLEDWLRSYRPEELFDEAGRVRSEITAPLTPDGHLRMSDNLHANGGALLSSLILPDWREYAVDVPVPGGAIAEAPRELGKWFTEIVRRNPHNFRIFGPDETASNRLQAVYDVTDKQWNAEFFGPDVDEHLAREGRVVEMLSEHQIEGWLEGYLLTGRHGMMSSYEAFIHLVSSMFNQHAKWLKVTNHLPWRRPIASLNYLLSSHVWRQDHNGFSHQDPGFLDHVINKKAETIRVYLPADANTLLATWDEVLRSKQLVNVVVSGKQPAPQFLTASEAARHFAKGLSIWEWAGTEVAGEAPDVVLAAAGDVPTMEVLAAASILREELPELRVRVVNVVNLLRLTTPDHHPDGLSDAEFDAIFTTDKPVIFNFHGYPSLIHRLVYRRAVHDNLHAKGFHEEGGTVTPFMMAQLNRIDRFSLVANVIDRVPGLAARYGGLREKMKDKRIEAEEYAAEFGDDLPEVREWLWPDAREHAAAGRVSATVSTGGDNE